MLNRRQLLPLSLLLSSLSAAVLVFGQGCAPAFFPLQSSGEKYLTDSERLACKNTPAGGAVNSLPSLVSYINGLPRPVRLHCLIANFPRPLYVQAGTSTRSAQPSPDPEDPRIFIRSGNLVLGFVIGGIAVNTLDVSEIKASDQSEKAEFVFPITEQTITEAAGLDHIRFMSGTSCGLCHRSETSSRMSGTSSVFKSEILRFTSDERITISELQRKARKCRASGDKSDRCLLLRSLFDGPDVLPVEF